MPVKLGIPEPPAGTNIPRYLDAFADPDTAESYWVFHRAAALIEVDAEATELIRLRNAVAQSCKWCLSARRADAWQGDGDAADIVMQFEESDLPERLKAGLRLGEAFLTVPSALSDEAKEAALKHFTPEEIVGMLFRLRDEHMGQAPDLPRPGQPDRRERADLLRVSRRRESCPRHVGAGCEPSTP